MFLTILGKEFIIINEELAIYISFLIVLTILVQNFGKQLGAQFAEQSNTIAQSYSIGSETKVKSIINKITNNYKTSNFIINMISFETASIYKLLKLKDSLVNAITAAEYKLV